MSAAPRPTAIACPHCYDRTRDFAALATHLRFHCTVLRPRDPDREPSGDRRSPLGDRTAATVPASV